MDFADIKRQLGVERSTVEVYLIDALVAGQELDHDRLLQLQEELCVKTRINEEKQSYPSVT